MTLKKSHYIIDSGNTFLKVASFNNDKLINVERFSNVDEVSIDEKLPGIFCSVNHENLFSNLINLRDINEKLTYPTHYEQSIGIDRKVLVYDLLKLRQISDAIIIDAGSFITIDFITNSTHMGGFIFPGLKNFLETYHIKGKKLPSLSVQSAVKPIDHKSFPQNTHEAISMAFKYYIMSIINLIEGQKNIYITGGDAKEIMGFINSSEVIHEENFLLEALNRIYTNLSNL